MSREREQKLVDLMFSVAFASAKSLHGMSQENIAVWVAKMLEVTGFPTKPCRSSWGVLVEPAASAMVYCAGCNQPVPREEYLSVGCRRCTTASPECEPLRQVPDEDRPPEAA